jgi:hypothetical protein
MTNTFGQTIDKHRKKVVKVQKTESWGTPDNKAWGDNLVPSTSTTIEPPLKNVGIPYKLVQK